ncbi:MAG: hypothetical protein JGK36_13340 [Microcoleus sp. PH2017_35_SFW_U_B]|nr:hypothetical protein [Microcoleus sp. PH2017_35_SFW_U_B]
MGGETDSHTRGAIEQLTVDAAAWHIYRSGLFQLYATAVPAPFVRPHRAVQVPFSPCTAYFQPTFSTVNPISCP